MASWFTLMIAAIVACIAFLQWRVARQKFVLDLFDRRFKAYNDVIDAVRPIMATTKTEQGVLFALQMAINNAKFLFGSDVNDYLQTIRLAAIKLNYWNSIYQTNSPQAPHSPQGIHDCMESIAEFFNKYPRLCAPYMIMPEKRVRTPIEWFHDQNALRKTYGDEPVIRD